MAIGFRVQTKKDPNPHPSSNPTRCISKTKMTEKPFSFDRETSRARGGCKRALESRVGGNEQFPGFVSRLAPRIQGILLAICLCSFGLMFWCGGEQGKSGNFSFSVPFHVNFSLYFDVFEGFLDDSCFLLLFFLLQFLIISRVLCTEKFIFFFSGEKILVDFCCLLDCLLFTWKTMC